jgi:hypothetical protein
MKLRPLFAIVMLCTLTGLAQEVAPEPTYDNQFFVLAEGRLYPLERQTVNTISANARMGWTGIKAKSAYEFPGVHSPVRFHSDQALNFIVRSPGAIQPSTDPNTLYVLQRLTTDKKNRKMVVSSVSTSLWSSKTSIKTSLTPDTQQVTFTPYGKFSTRITSNPLPPGEYVLSTTPGMTDYCFGVD